MEAEELGDLYKAIDDALIQGHERDLMYEIAEAEKLAAKLERRKRRKYRVRICLDDNRRNLHLFICEIEGFAFKGILFMSYKL